MALTPRPHRETSMTIHGGEATRECVGVSVCVSVLYFTPVLPYLRRAKGVQLSDESRVDEFR